MTRYLFVVGLPRSGTKLLRDLLNNHSKVSLLDNETDLYPTFLHFFASDPPADGWFEALWERVRESKFFIRRRAAGRDVDPAVWKSHCTGMSAAGAFEGLLKAALPIEAQTTILGDKSPLHVTCVGELLRDFPEGLVLHIVRDGREVALSAVQAWQKDPLRALQQWTDQSLAAHSAGQQHPTRYKLVNYESLTSDPEALLREVCDFLGLEFEPGMEGLKRSAEGLGRAKGEARVMQLGQRQASVSQQKLRRMEEICAPAAREFGYALETQPKRVRRLSAWEMRILRMKDAVGVVRFHAKQFGMFNGLKYALRRVALGSASADAR